MMPESLSDQPALGAAQPPLPTAGTNPLGPSQNSAAPSLNPLSVPQAASPGVTTGVPQVAEDSDLIETEWVDAAKKIIQDNHDDPYNQNRAMTLLRADYMKKRYNKDIKIPEN